MVLNTFECKFSILDELPEALYAPVITHAHGELVERARGIMQWRDALLKGQLPDSEQLIWPEAQLKRTILMRLETLDIVPYCRQQEVLTDSILESILEGINSAEDYFSKAGEFNDRLAQQQKIRDRDSSFKDEDNVSDHVDSKDSGSPENHEPGEPQAADSPDLSHKSASDGENQSIHMAATEPTDSTVNDNPQPSDTPSPSSRDNEAITEQSPVSSTQEVSIGGQPIEALSDHLEHQWGELAANWHEISTTFDELGGFLGKGWDLSQGALASQGWREIIRYRKLVKQLPQIQQLIATLGRMRDIAGADPRQSVTEQVIAPLQRVTDHKEDVISPLAVNETGGIQRSDDIARMLPGELALLGHPKLNMLWHAKRAERTLLTYQLQGVLSEHSPAIDDSDITDTPESGPASEGYGPILVCLDTSASMQGEAENIAKALVLEALRIAWQEQRACYVYSFSGHEQVLEHALDLSTGGIGELLEFLTHSFQGGTDVYTPLKRALDKQQQQGWEQADILLVTDGRFPDRPELSSLLTRLKATQGLRLHGVIVGNWQGKTLETLCSPLHRLKLSPDKLSVESVKPLP